MFRIFLLFHARSALSHVKSRRMVPFLEGTFLIKIRHAEFLNL